MTPLLGLAVILAAAGAVGRRYDVRLVLFLAALALGCLGGDPAAILREFLINFSKEQYVIPIGTAMGFAYVLRQTGCDRHLVQALTRPLRYTRALLVPGMVLVGFLVNVPVISQTSTAVCLGPVVVPLMRAARFPPALTGATLLLGASVGGELLNPGAPELLTVGDTLKIGSGEMVAFVFPLALVQLSVAGGLFWLFSLREASDPGPADAVPAEAFRVNWVKAAVPLLPLALLFLTGPPLELARVPHGWLVTGTGRAADLSFGPRLIGAAMLVGVAAAALADRRGFADTAKHFFDGAGYAFAQVVSLIVVANCFGKGIEKVGVAGVLASAIGAAPGLLLPLAGGLPLAFAALSGSGMASTQSLYAFFVQPALDTGVDPRPVGAVVALGAAAGRTLSPVAAVTLMCASLTGTNPLALSRRVALPLLAGTAAAVAAAALGSGTRL